MKALLISLALLCFAVLSPVCHADSAQEPGPDDYTYEKAMAYLQSPGEDVRFKGTLILLDERVVIKPEAFDTLFGIINNDKSIFVKENAAVAIARLKDDRATDSIIKLFATDHVPFVYYPALANIGSEKAVNFLSEKLKNYKNLSENETSSLLEGIGVLRDEVAVNMISPFLTNDSNVLKNAAIRALGRSESPLAYKLLLPFANSRDDKKQYQLAIKAMANLKSKEAHEYVLNAVNDPDVSVQKAALDASQQINGDDAIDLALKGLKDNKDAIIRLAYARYLTKYASKVPHAPLFEALNDENAPVRVELVHCIGKGYTKDDFFPLCKVLNDTDWRVIEAVVSALGASKDVRAVKPLIEALNNRLSEIRVKAVWGLGELKDRKALWALNTLPDREFNVEVLQAALVAFTKQNDKNTPAAIVIIIQRLHEQQQQTEKDAAETLKKLTGNAYTGDPKDWK